MIALRAETFIPAQEQEIPNFPYISTGTSYPQCKFIDDKNFFCSSTYNMFAYQSPILPHPYHFTCIDELEKECFIEIEGKPQKCSIKREPLDFSVSPDKKFIAAGLELERYIFQTNTPISKKHCIILVSTETLQEKILDIYPLALSFAPDSTHLAIIDNQGSLYIHNVKTGTVQRFQLPITIPIITKAGTTNPFITRLDTQQGSGYKEATIRFQNKSLSPATFAALYFTDDGKHLIEVLDQYIFIWEIGSDLISRIRNFINRKD